jgi:hypothetical protein
LAKIAETVAVKPSSSSAQATTFVQHFVSPKFCRRRKQMHSIGPQFFHECSLELSAVCFSRLFDLDGSIQTGEHHEQAEG